MFRNKIYNLTSIKSYSKNSLLIIKDYLNFNPIIKTKITYINGWIVIKISQIKYYKIYYLQYLNNEQIKYMIQAYDSSIWFKYMIQVFELSIWLSMYFF